MLSADAAYDSPSVDDTAGPITIPTAEPAPEVAVDLVKAGS